MRLRKSNFAQFPIFTDNARDVHKIWFELANSF